MGLSASKIFDFITIRNRKEITVDGEKIIDFTGSVIDFKFPLKFSEPPVVVSQEFEGRPHLIAKLKYGTEELTDLLLFFNGISNPLSVQKGMILAIPDRDSMLANVRDINKTETNNVSKSKFNEKLSKKDKDRIQQLIDRNNIGQASTGDFRTPNMVKDGTQDVTPIDGRVVLGTNVSDVRCKNQISGTQTLTELTRAAVKEKLKTKSVSVTNPSLVKTSGNDSTQSRT